MGSAKSSLYSGHGTTPEQACTALQDQLQRHLCQEAVVNVTPSDDFSMELTSPRGVRRVATAKIVGDGLVRIYPVTLVGDIRSNNKNSEGLVEFTASVQIKRKK